MQRIAESELIINHRKAIYHLDVKPDEIAQTILTVGDPDRVKEVSKHFDNIEFKMQHREFNTYISGVGIKFTMLHFKFNVVKMLTHFFYTIRITHG